MKNIERIILFAVIIIIFSIPLLFRSKETVDNPEPIVAPSIVDNPALTLPKTIQLASSNESVDFEDYVMGVVAAEMPASYHIEALKAQAIAARTYAIVQTEQLTKPIEITTAHQVYFPVNNLSEVYEKKVREAVLSTKQMLLIHDGQPISAMFHAASNGLTESSYNFSGYDRPYLQSVPSPEEKLTTHRFSLSELNHLLSANFSLEQVKDAKLERNDTNRVKKITIGNVTWNGREFREKLSLASTDFIIQIIEGRVQIIANGYGHGVGMSQQGANELAAQGYTYEDILKHYYGEVEIQTYDIKE